MLLLALETVTCIEGNCAKLKLAASCFRQQPAAANGTNSAIVFAWRHRGHAHLDCVGSYTDLLTCPPS